jgi:hypothetical protein
MPAFIDLTGYKFGSLTALKRVPAPIGVRDHTRWLCRCACGQEQCFRAHTLRGGNVTRCRKCTVAARTTHGASYEPRYRMLMQAKARAKKNGLPFNIKLCDIAIPEVCPLLGIPLAFGNTRLSPNNPSLDRIIPALGYVKGNIWVISWRANTIKNNASIEELARIVRNLKRAIIGAASRPAASSEQLQLVLGKHEERRKQHNWRLDRRRDGKRVNTYLHPERINAP